jgi:hypothetical protein
MGFDGSDKLGTLAAYSVLMNWFAQICIDRRRRVSLALAFVAMGLMLEFLQTLSGYRSAEWADGAANAAGRGGAGLDHCAATCSELVAGH